MLEPVAHDDESTRPIDIEALRNALPSKGAQARPKSAREAAEAFQTDEHTAIGQAVGVDAEIEDVEEVTAMEDGAPAFAPFGAFAGQLDPELDDDPGHDSGDAATEVPSDRRPFEALFDARGPLGAPPASSVTQLELDDPRTGAVFSIEQPAATVSPPSTTRIDVAQSMPGTVPAHELVQALVAVMGARSERIDRLADTDEGESHTSDQTLNPAVDSTLRDASEEPDPHEHHEDSATASGLAFPRAWSDVEVTSVSPGRPVPPSRQGAVSSQVTAVPDLPPRPAEMVEYPPGIAHPADDLDETRMGRLDQADVRAAFAAAEAGESTVIRSSPVSSERAERARRPEPVPPPPQSESSIVEVDSMELESEPDMADLARTQDTPVPPRPSDPLPSFAVDGDDEDVGDAPGDETGERPEAAPDSGALPRFAMASMDDIFATDAPSHAEPAPSGEDPQRDDDPQRDEATMMGHASDADIVLLSAAENDIQLVSNSGVSVVMPDYTSDANDVAGEADRADIADVSSDVHEVRDSDEVSYDDDDGGRTLYRRSDPELEADVEQDHTSTAAAAPEPRGQTHAHGAAAAQQPHGVAPKRDAAPSPPGYQPPAPVGRALAPAYENDTDDDEDQLQREGGFRALLDLYRLRIGDAGSPIEKAALLHKIASVYEYRLDEQEAAFAALVEAFELRPGDDDIVASLDRVARVAGRIGELADRARKNLHTADLELKVILLGHIVFWYERVLSRSQEMSPFVSELERLDKTHPVVLRRQAMMAAQNGDVKSQRELLVRALDRTSRREEKVHLHIALASAHAGTPEAMKHYEAAVAIDASSIVALQGLERIGREQGKHGQVEWCLERQSEVAATTAERIDALMKLADLQETKYLRREKAAEILERVIELEPSHPQALKALERCYHALRDWPRLAPILRARADNTYDKKAKTELLELAAEVFEAKMGDPASAIEVHRDLLVVDPKHRRALSDLARLYEKLGDWGNMSTYKARVAELAPSKRQASQLLVQLGDFLSAPERDPISARIQYERAVTIDPTNATAWEALQRVATEQGDDRRVAECLEQRARNVEAPRQRAAIYVELANIHLGNGADRAAREAFEDAVNADGTNEPAASAMLDVYSREEKWDRAAPLCELLVNAAKRDNDMRALFTRLRLSTRIAAALGDASSAMTSALAALDLEPDDDDAQSDLVAVCSQCRDAPKVVARAKDWLVRIAAGPLVLPSPVLVGLALIQRDAGEVDAAANTLERALDADPDHPEVLKELADVYLAQGDFPRCCKLKVDLARNATSADGRFQLLCDAGEIWARRAEELDKAATVFEEARLIKPHDHWLLHTLMWLYGERHRWDELSNVLEGIAQIQESPEKKAKSFFAMAQVVLEKVGDPVRAAELFDQVLDIDKKRLDAFELLVRALTEAKDWEALEVSYRKMIGRIKDDAEPNPNLQFALFHQLGLIYRDRLEDAERAYEALEAAARLRPDDVGVRKIVTELLVVTDNLDNAVERTRELIIREPHDAELYSELYELFLRQHAFDKAWCAVNVLAQLREPSPEQQRFHQDYMPMPLDEVPGQIVEQAWFSHVFHKDLDPTLTTLFARMTPAVARMRYAQLRPDQLVYAVGRPFTPSHSRLYEAIRATFANAAEILHMSPPELLLGDPSASVPFAPALAPFGAVHVGVPAVEARADALVYVVGKRLAEQRPELIARSFFPAVSDLTSLLAAAVRVSRQEGAKDAAGAALDASLAAILMPQERDGIRQVVMQAAMVGGLVDVKRWSQAADLSSMRAGLLVCGDVGPARRSILAEPQSTADLPPREKIAELYRFAISDLYSDLRGAIGIAVQA